MHVWLSAHTMMGKPFSNPPPLLLQPQPPLPGRASSRRRSRAPPPPLFRDRFPPPIFLPRPNRTTAVAASGTMTEQNGIDILCDAAGSDLLLGSLFPAPSTHREATQRPSAGPEQPPSSALSQRTKRAKLDDAPGASPHVCHICKRVYERYSTCLPCSLARPPRTTSSACGRRGTLPSRPPDGHSSFLLRAH